MSSRDDRAKEVLRWIAPDGRSIDAVNAIVAAPLLERQRWSWRTWWIAFAVSLALTGAMAISIAWLLIEGIGIFGNNTTVVWGLHDNIAPLRVPNLVWQTYLKNKPGTNRYWVVPGADHYLQCDAPAQLAQIVRLTAQGDDIPLQTLGNQPDGAVLIDQSATPRTFG